MKLLELLKISLKNIVKRLKSSIKIFIGFSLVSMILISFFSFDKAYSNSIEELRNEGNNLYSISVRKAGYEPFTYDADAIESISGVKSAEYMRVSINLTRMNQKVIIDDVEYAHASYINSVYIDYTKEDIPYNEREKYLSISGSENYIKYGRFINAENEFMASENIIRRWGYENSESLLGSTFRMHGDNNTIVVNDMVLVGIIDEGINNLLVLPLNSIIESQVLYSLVVYSNDYASLIGIRDQLNILLPFSRTEISIPENEEEILSIKKQQGVVESLISIFGIIIVSTIIANILLSLIFSIKQKGAYYGILEANGMRKWHLFLISFIELLILFIVSLVFSFIVAINIFRLVNTVLASQFSFSFTIGFGDYMMIFLSSAGIGIIIITLLSCLSMFGLLKKPICRLLAV